MISKDELSVSFDETTTETDVVDLLKAFEAKDIAEKVKNPILSVNQISSPIHYLIPIILKHPCSGIYDHYQIEI